MYLCHDTYTVAKKKTIINENGVYVKLWVGIVFK